MSSVFLQSQVQPLHFSLFENAYEIDILRDDLIHPLVSGNKWRKLKYVVPYILNEAKIGIVTFGGAYSNHLVATSFVAKEFGLESYAFVRGNEERELNAFEKICIENGMQLIHVSRDAYKDKEVLYKTYFEERQELEMIAEGGRHPKALEGCEEIIYDLQKVYDYIILSVGTGTTMEGIVKAITKKKLQTKVIGISSLKGNYELDQIMEQFPRQFWRIEHNYHRGKYAKNDIQLKQFMEEFQTETSIKLEFVYTGKMVMAFADLLKQNIISKGSKILLIHTGGLPDLL